MLKDRPQIAPLKLFEVRGSLGVKHLVSARSEGHAVQVVTKALHLSSKELDARQLDAMSAAHIIRSDYPEDEGLS